MPAVNVDTAVAYYVNALGFHHDWGHEVTKSVGKPTSENVLQTETRTTSRQSQAYDLQAARGTVRHLHGSSVAHVHCASSKTYRA